MSLLLLFPSEVSTGTGGFACWLPTATVTSAWALSHYDLKDVWSEWVTFTWAQIASSGYTWQAMAGKTFVVVGTTDTPWTTTTVSTCGGV